LRESKQDEQPPRGRGDGVTKKLDRARAAAYVTFTFVVCIFRDLVFIVIILFVHRTVS